MNLKIGEIYFIVSFKDGALTIPLVKSLVYSRVVTREDGSKGYLFDQISDDNNSEQFYVDEAHVEELVLDRQGLLRMLEQTFQGTLATQGWKP